MLIGSARLQIWDPRYDGYVGTHGFGADYVFNPPKDLRYRSSLHDPEEMPVPEWSFSDAQFVPGLRAVCLRGWPAPAHTDLTTWSIISGSYWKNVLPLIYPQKNWLKWYDARADVAGGKVRRNASLPSNPSFIFHLLRSAAPAGQVASPQVQLILNDTGQVRWRLEFRLPGTAAGGGMKYPTLARSADGGSTWTLLDEFQALGATDEQPDPHTWFTFHVLADRIIIHLSQAEREWVYYEQGLLIEAGQPAVFARYGQMAFNLAPIEYPSSGTVERTRYVTYPTWVNATPTLSTINDLPSGGGVAVSLQTNPLDGTQKRPLLTMTSSDVNRTPVVYLIQEKREPAIAAGVTTVKFDNSLQAHLNRLRRCSWTLNRRWRGSTFEVVIRNPDGSYTFGGNEKAQLAVAADVGAGPVSTTQAAGYLIAPEAERIPDPFDTDLRLRFQDLTCRLEKKLMLNMPSFGGWSLSDALTYVLHRSGVPDALISLDAGASEWTLPQRKGDRAFAFDATVDVMRALDELCAACFHEWGVNVGGQVFSRLIGTPNYGGTPDFTVDQASVGETDLILAFRAEGELEEFRNHFLITGRDSQGEPVSHVWRDTLSVSDPTASNFIGDDWWKSVNWVEAAAPNLIALYEMIRSDRMRKLVLWRTHGKPSLLPDHFVLVNVGNLGVPLGTIFRIIEKRGSLDVDANDFATEFVGAIE